MVWHCFQACQEGLRSCHCCAWVSLAVQEKDGGKQLRACGQELIDSTGPASDRTAAALVAANLGGECCLLIHMMTEY